MHAYLNGKFAARARASRDGYPGDEEGEKAVSAESVAKRAVDAARSYLVSEAAVGQHLADQLLLPMALVGGG
jgi:RNA 3'-terminal phosphate cyclase